MIDNNRNAAGKLSEGAVVAKLDRTTPLATRAYQAIKQMIIRNELEPGHSVTETGIAEKLGISRSPVRNALARLHEERFLEAEQWTGLRVAPLDRNYVRELYELRTILEGLCAHKSAKLISDDEIEALASAKDRIEPLLRAGESREWDVLEPKFHDLVTERCDNEMLKTLLARLHDHWDRVRNAIAPAIAEHKLKDFEENQRILDAMRTRDPAQLQAAVETHVSNVAARMLDAFDQGKVVLRTPRGDKTL